MEMENFYRQFCNEAFDENEVLTYFEPKLADNFNFAYDVVDAIATSEPTRRAMVWCNDKGEEKILSFGEIKLASDKCAQMLASRGIIKGDLVLLVLKRRYEFWFTILALHKLGAIAVPASHMLTSKDYLYRFEQAKITACVIFGEESAKSIDEACLQYPFMRTKFLIGAKLDNWLNYSEELEKYDGKRIRTPTLKNDPMLLYFTSGTAAEPKMVLHNHAYPAAHIVTARYWQDVHADDLHFSVAETGWIKAVWGKLYGQWFAGASIFVYDYDSFVATELLHMIEKYHVTTFCAPPTIYRFLVREKLEDYNLLSLRYSTTSGEALNPEVFEHWQKLTGLPLMESFGQTETVLLIGNFVGMIPKAGSMGKPSPQCTLRLVDMDGMSIPAGAVGEICVNVKRPHFGLCSDCDCSDGLYHTGDTAWMDEEGYFWYIGRIDDVIKASGYRIGPFEIESVLMTHPAVLECAVTGAPDVKRGTVIKATVVLNDGYIPSEVLIKELQDFVKKQTAPYKYPRIIDFVSELPKTISGKIQRFTIRERDKA